MLPGDVRDSPVSGPRSNVGLRLQRPKADLSAIAAFIPLSERITAEEIAKKMMRKPKTKS